MVQQGLRAPLPAAVPAPPPGEFVPTYGYRQLSHGERLTLAGHMLAQHQPDSPVVRVGLSWPFIAVPNRHCTWCRNAWPCMAARWAEQVQFHAYGWAL